MLHQIFLALMAASLFFVPGYAPVAKSYNAERFDVDMVVEEANTLLVTETLALNFSGGPFTYVFRELPTDHTDGIDDIHAEMDGVELPAGTEAGQVEIKGADPIRITWHFAPTTDRTHTYTLRYRVHGVIRQETDADLLLWQVLPEEHDYTIAGSTLTVHYPNADLLGMPEIRQGDASIATETHSTTFTASNLAKNETLVVALRFPAGSFISAAPEWQTRGNEIDRSAPRVAVIATLCALVGIALIVIAQSRYRYPGRADDTFQTRPPAALPPAIAGAVANRCTMETAWGYALGALFDLAQRGVISIEEVERSSWFRSHDFIIKLHEQPADLRDHERGLLDALFLTKQGLTSAVLFSKLQSNITGRLKAFTKPLEEELDRMGAFDPERRRWRNTQMIAGLGILLGGLVFAIVLGVALSGASVLWAIAAGSVALILCVAMMIAGASTNPMSDEWQAQGVMWKQFGKYLQKVTRRHETLSRREMAIEYLPYAAAMGLAGEWANYMKKHEATDVPTWFRALANTPDHNYAAFIVMLSVAHSTGGAASGGAVGAAAAGAAGGGASGAG
ncbi:MAG: DUF2207 domain-containing protein [Anaerolineae bacterium]|nr:DUF2207 domain-containing protein [Anaerolineae bacterium]